MLGTNFIEYYKKFREGFTASTSTFFIDERDRLKEEIALLDKKISEFKEKNVNELPELFQLNYNMTHSLTQKLFDTDQQIQMLASQKRTLESNLITLNPLIGMTSSSGERIITPEEKLASLEYQLGLQLSTFSEKHPDVRRTKNEIAKLEKIITEKKRSAPKETTNNRKSADSSSYFSKEFEGVYNPAYINMVTQLEQISSEIEKLQQEKAQTEIDLREYETRVGKTPLVEQEYVTMKRDLENAQKRYNDLTSQVLTLESSAAMEQREMGGKLTIGQPPSFPLKPVRPNKPLIIAGSFFLGTVLGVLLLLGWDFISQTVRTPQDISNIIPEAPVLSVFPILTAEKKKRLSPIKLAGPIGLGILILIIVFIDLFYINIDILIIKIFAAIKTNILMLGF